MKIYTGTGDSGKTGLYSGERIRKNNPRVEAYGTLDELNAIIGALIASMPETEKSRMEELRRIQVNLLCAGAWLATTPDSPAASDLDEITPAHVRRIEEAIDMMEKALLPLSFFILPGGHAVACWAHIARTVCRRAERKIVDFFENQPNQIPAPLRNILAYVNRLSDYFFVLARFCNRQFGVPDIPWKK